MYQAYTQLVAEWSSPSIGDQRATGCGLLKVTRTLTRSLLVKIGDFLLIFLKLKVHISCGPEQESCISKQILNDDSCLVACDGLYADITDHSLQQKTIEGHIQLTKSSCFIFTFTFRIARLNWSAKISSALPWIRRKERRWTWLLERTIQELQRELCQTFTVWPEGTQRM